MTRYKKSIHTALEEVGEWQPPTEPEVLVEEAPIPTGTGMELLKKRIAHTKIEKKELKYYPMGDVFRGKLQKTTEHLKEALELDEIDEAVKWEVKVSGLPVFYSDGKSKGAVRQMLRKLLKHPDDILSINRVTSTELKKIRRAQIAGDEPGDEDEDKNPVGPSYNEEIELVEEVSVKEFDSLKKGNTLNIKYKSSMSSGEGTFIVKSRSKSKKYNVDKITLQSKTRPGSVKFYLYKRNNKVSLAQGDMGASLVSMTKEETEWDQMWKRAAKEKPKMSFKQASQFVDDVGLDKKEKTNALKTAKKWLK